MITYNDLYEAARKERYSDQLQPLPKNFILEVANYLNEKKQLSLKEDDGFSDMIAKTKKQLENATTLFKELRTRRRKKILSLVLIAAETGISKQDFENMLQFEKSLFEDLMKGIEASDKQVYEMLKGKKQDLEKNELVVFKTNVGEFMGMEGEKIGPFEKGQVANISKEVAAILIEDGKAEVLEK
ncbi:MAG TPA: DNA replication complex GINS family protein [Candidatus Pacearchaeota archaeon]|nr:DNA replication complex GINS family protein [Candidatus Pacearchaeota archaeon]